MEKLTDGKETKIRPLADITPIYDCDRSKYPETIKVAMADGQVVTYRIDVLQPMPQFDRVMEILQNMPIYGGSKQTVGYQYKPKHEKKTDRWERFLAARKKG